MRFSNRFDSTLFSAAQHIHIADRGVLSMGEREARASFLIQEPSKKKQKTGSS